MSGLDYSALGDGHGNHAGPAHSQAGPLGALNHFALAAMSGLAGFAANHIWNKIGAEKPSGPVNNFYDNTIDQDKYGLISQGPRVNFFSEKLSQAGFNLFADSLSDDSVDVDKYGLSSDGQGADPLTSIKGLHEIKVKPGVPGIFQVTFLGPSSIFIYPGLLTDEACKEFRTGAMDRNGWVFGVKAYDVNATANDGRRKIAVPTGVTDDVLRGRLLSWPPNKFKEQLQKADQLVGYDPKKLKEKTTLLRRSVIAVVKKDGTKTKAYWYFQGAIEEVIKKREIDERTQIVKKEIMQVEAAERLLGWRRKKQPTLIVSYGPPGSGKSTVLSALLRNKSFPPYDAWVDGNIDRIVATYDTAVPVIQKLILDQCLRCHIGTDMQDDPDIIGNPQCSPYIELWLHARSNEIYAASLPRLTRVNDELIAEGLRKKKNILLEMSGSRNRGLSGVGALLWASDLAKKHGYFLVFVYPLVTADKLYDRIKNRACETGQVPIPEEVSKTSSGNAVHNFLQVILPSAPLLADELVLWNNNKPPDNRKPLPMHNVLTKGMPFRPLAVSAASKGTAESKGWSIDNWAHYLNSFNKDLREGTADGLQRMEQTVSFLQESYRKNVQPQADVPPAATRG
eukprot:g71574.t1